MFFDNIFQFSAQLKIHRFETRSSTGGSVATSILNCNDKIFLSLYFQMCYKFFLLWLHHHTSVNDIRSNRHPFFTNSVGYQIYPTELLLLVAKKTPQVVRYLENFNFMSHN